MGWDGMGRTRKGTGKTLFVRHFGTTELQGCAPLFNRGLGSLHTDLPHLSAFRSDAAFNGDDALKPSLLFFSPPQLGNCFTFIFAYYTYRSYIHTIYIYI
ncbi:hypothetical protein IscW_ISCW024021 [Ixodes scapularis]|uniref:Uncharacterized protein n=1 Tax=Ixodes scapularis TaxID=6945 RepID=B7P468_IXOSC|nr:hypothetical protein IscW_ISCW024021 [Ixodes scapularis]|eukprot:XP_002405461.1 hypothetical protein IscW_ISCW024021 [Ixodes scapularis]